MDILHLFLKSSFLEMLENLLKLRQTYSETFTDHKSSKSLSKSPDLNPLDYWFWSASMAEVRRVQPQSLDELKLCVENYAKSLSKNQINKSVAHIFKRAQCCIAKQGGSFESLLKKKVKDNGDE